MSLRLRPQPPGAETAAQITERAQIEATRRYPGIGIKNSPENLAFIAKVNELRNAGADEYFRTPDWPLRLAETLAQTEGWSRQNGQPVDGSAAAPAKSPTPEENTAPAGQTSPPDGAEPAGNTPTAGCGTRKMRPFPVPFPSIAPLRRKIPAR